MRKIIATVGLPGSGKSTWASQYQKDNPNTVIVCRDDLRRMLVDYKFSKRNEKLVASIRDQVIVEAILNDRDVIVADTNLAPKTQNALIDLAASLCEKANVELVFESFLDVPVHVCVERDLKREHSVGRDVIMKMWRQHVAKPVERNDEGLPKAIIVDIDGTLAIRNGRSPYDMSRVGEDSLNEVVAETIERFSDDHVVIVMSGRDVSCRDETIDWLYRHGVPFDALYMRDVGDSRRDSVVKGELFSAYVDGVYDVRLVFDDRDQVVTETWRTLGLTCFQVAEGNF